MAALSHAGTLFVMTHDSIGLGEDGPTHQPVEHLASFRAMPNILMLRPGDGNETAGAYQASPAPLRCLKFSCLHAWHNDSLGSLLTSSHRTSVWAVRPAGACVMLHFSPGGV